MHYDILAMLVIVWLFTLGYIWYAFEDFKNWKELDLYLKVVMLHMVIGFIAFSFILVLFILNAAGIIGEPI